MTNRYSVDSIAISMDSNFIQDHAESINTPEKALSNSMLEFELLFN